MTFSDLVFAVLSGFLGAAAFPKIEWPFMAWIALIPLLAVLARKGARKRWLAGGGEYRHCHLRDSIRGGSWRCSPVRC